METEILVNGNWVEGIPTKKGQRYRKKIGEAGNTGYMYTLSSQDLYDSTETIQMTGLKINQDYSDTNSKVFYAKSADTLEVLFSCSNFSKTQELPLNFSLPLDKYVQGLVVDQVFMEFNKGVDGFTLQGVLPSSGTWILDLNNICKIVSEFGISFLDKDPIILQIV